MFMPSIGISPSVPDRPGDQVDDGGFPTGGTYEAAVCPFSIETDVLQTFSFIISRPDIFSQCFFQGRPVCASHRLPDCLLISSSYTGSADTAADYMVLYFSAVVDAKAKLLDIV